MKDIDWRGMFGFCIVLVLSLLAALIALGKVEETTSHGLMPLVTALATLAGAWSQWAFRAEPPKKDRELEP